MNIGTDCLVISLELEFLMVRFSVCLGDATHAHRHTMNGGAI